MRSLIKRLRHRLHPRGPSLKHSRASYAQEGEDLILWRLFEPDVPKPGFYVDIGAHHPSRFSTTRMFYDQGWRGLNVDARPGCMVDFCKQRPRDINVEAAVAGEKGEMTYYMFNEPALNGFDASLSVERDGLHSYRIIDSVPVSVLPLAEVLETYLPDEQRIDFLTVDVEGLDAAVLGSNDWRRFRPRFVLAEVLSPWLRDALKSDVARILGDAGYDMLARSRSTCFFESRAER